jgi:hypothetical protein
VPKAWARRALLGCAAAAALAYLGSASAGKPFRVYPGFEGYADTELPPDYQVPGEFVVGRLMYPSYRGYFGSNWEQGGTSWAVDYPRGDRKLAEVLRRFTRTDVRSVEQPVNPNDGDDIYDWPFLMVGLAGYWDLTDQQVLALRTYLLRGGFLFADSFFGSDSWVGFQEGLQRIFPDRPIIDLTDEHPVFHTVYDIPAMTTVQIPNMNALYSRGVGYLSDGRTPRWRGIEDDRGRLMVLIAFNNDVADSWQWADEPRYPAEAANLGLRIGVNIAAYALTH